MTFVGVRRRRPVTLTILLGGIGAQGGGRATQCCVHPDHQLCNPRGFTTEPADSTFLTISAFLVRNTAVTPKPYQIDSSENGALSLACQKAQPYVAAARAAGTRRLYRSAFKRWAEWCAAMHTSPLPAEAETIAAYLAELARAGKSVATIKGALAAILYVHREQGHAIDSATPAIATVMAGITRRSSRPIRRAPALEIESLRSVIASISGSDLRSLRDRALLLIGFFGALRRSELVALDIKGRTFAEILPQGLILHLTATKASAATQSVCIPRRADELCATRAVEEYLATAGISHGPLFPAVSKAGRLLERRLDATSVRHILKARAGDRKLSPHSLRSGFITSAAKRGVPEHVIQATSRHKSADVLRSYIRAGDGFAGCAAHHL
jgi:integrase